MTDKTHSAPLDATHIAPLDGDDIPNENQAHNCFSCKSPITGKYCVNCGQKNDDYRRSIFALILEMGANLTAIEGRMWRTWAVLLFNPGKVAREYADGARTSWSSPIRIYIAMSLILFGFMTLTNTHLFSLDVNVQVKDGVEKAEAELGPDDLSFDLGAHMFERQSTIDERNSTRNFDLIKLKLFDPEGSLLNLNIAVGEEDTIDSDSDLDSGINDAPPEKTGFVLNNKPVSQENVSTFIINFIQNPTAVTRTFKRWLPRLMFFMMPLTMFIGAIFIRGRKNAMLYDHIVHAAYIHSVAFFLIFIGVLASYVLPGNIIAKGIFILLLIYLPLSLKRMFGRSWPKTLWTSYGVGVIYSIILFIGMSIILGSGITSTIIPSP